MQANWAADRERVFARSWQALAPEDVPAEAGEARPLTLLPGLLDEPLLLVRGADGGLHALSNVCTHRAALVCPAPARARELRCPYHGRRFALDGRFRAAPGFEEAEGFPTPADDLPRAAREALGPLHLVALEPAYPAAAWTAAARSRFDALGWSAWRHDPAGERRYPLRAHWAAYVENYLEGFHVPYVHPGLSRALDLARYTTADAPCGVLQIAEARPDEAAFAPPQGHPEHGRRVAAWYLWLFPNLMLNVYPWGLSVNVVEPRGPAESVVRYHRFLRDPALLGTGAGADLDQVEREDQAVVESVQRGDGARLRRGGALSPRHEGGIARFRALWAAARAG
jgi:choline monooxygenase